jgi:hypothetical protein
LIGNIHFFNGLFGDKVGFLLLINNSGFVATFLNKKGYFLNTLLYFFKKKVISKKFFGKTFLQESLKVLSKIKR